ncbi:DDE-type integrase/transposase/recombinase [Bowmanella denitrificans]|uniref:DDE-type integrase/transposase/recombinase n=1 Tax=Bowmanella denitrificans TaxID=366582 RepID=UPI001558DB0E|nr:DDE-type integrase/transposase/recombinase [Bowmanella denitrificans]
MGINQVELDVLRALIAQLGGARHGEKGKILKDAAALYGWSMPTLYRKLEDMGWRSGRKRRVDAGQSSVDDQTMTVLESLRVQSVRKNGKLTMPTTVARGIAINNGYQVDVTPSTLNRLMRRRGTSNQALRTDSPHTRVRSLHPNHVHQVDPSLCLVYYLGDGKQYIMEADQFYKNKLENYAKVKLKCWRYVLVDHYSATMAVRYYAAAGENTRNLFDFLCFAWQKDSTKVLHGVPKILYWDKGSANTSPAIKHFLDQLDVQHLTHEAGKARAKGAVEGANNLVETQFECRLKFEPVDNVDQLNAAAATWCHAYNANCIPGQDTRLSRKGMATPLARYGLWQTIRKEHLRLLPNEDICRALLTSKPQERTVAANLTISFRHPHLGKSAEYSLRDCAGVQVGMKVLVAPLVYSAADIRVDINLADGSHQVHHIGPEQFDSLSGMPVAGPVFGENYAAAPDTDVERRKKAADRAAYPDLNDQDIAKAKAKQKTPFNGQIKAHSYLQDAASQTPAYMQKTGSQIEPTAIPKPQQRMVSRVQMKMWLLGKLFRDFTADELAWLNSLEDVAEQDLETILSQIRDGVPAKPALRVVS